MDSNNNRCPKCGEILPAFGFTRDDVKLLRECAYAAGTLGSTDVSEEEGQLLASLADRIEALLPELPEKEGAPKHYCKDCRSEFNPGDLDARDGFCSRSCEMAFYDRLRSGEGA